MVFDTSAFQEAQTFDGINEFRFGFSKATVYADQVLVVPNDTQYIVADELVIEGEVILNDASEIAPV
jgi:hypothetical protein